MVHTLLILNPGRKATSSDAYRGWTVRFFCMCCACAEYSRIWVQYYSNRYFKLENSTTTSSRLFLNPRLASCHTREENFIHLLFTIHTWRSYTSNEKENRERSRARDSWENKVGRLNWLSICHPPSPLPPSSRKKHFGQVFQSHQDLILVSYFFFVNIWVWKCFSSQSSPYSSRGRNKKRYSQKEKIDCRYCIDAVWPGDFNIRQVLRRRNKSKP
jgi:hypothetical protein